MLIWNNTSGEMRYGTFQTFSSVKVKQVSPKISMITVILCQQNVIVNNNYRTNRVESAIKCKIPWKFSSFFFQSNRRIRSRKYFLSFDRISLCGLFYNSASCEKKRSMKKFIPTRTYPPHVSRVGKIIIQQLDFSKWTISSCSQRGLQWR